MKYIILIFSILIVSQINLKTECYCLNLEDSQVAMIDECIEFKPNNEFTYWWKSDLSFVKEKGSWIKKNDTILITTTNQPRDFIKLNRNKSKEITDSVEIKIKNDFFEDKSIISLVKYSKDSILQIPFNSSGELKIKSDIENEYGINAMLIPWQFKFNIEPNDKSINIELKLMAKIHKTFFENERIQLKGDKAYWIDKFKESENYLERVDKKVIKRKFKKK